MHTHQFGKKIKLPATIAIKHQIRKLMWEDLVKETEVTARAEPIRRSLGEETLLSGKSLISPPPAGAPTPQPRTAQKRERNTNSRSSNSEGIGLSR
jgi:hypothetical protein